jgi:hypothetical protein
VRGSGEENEAARARRRTGDAALKARAACRARHGRRGRPAATVVLVSASHGRMGHAGPSGLKRTRAVRTGSGLRARPVRNRIVFFLFFFFSEFISSAKTIPAKTRNCLRARKILRKSQKF